jgi:C4-dicarboxylate-specific signal transduction histidine kinase
MEAELQAHSQHLEQLVADKVKEVQQERAMSIQAGKLAALGEMATGVAHELNQPLTAMLFDANYLKKMTQEAQNPSSETPPLDLAELYEIGEDLSRDIARCRRIIDHLRTFARVSDGRVNKINLNKPIEDSFILIGERLKQHGVQVDLQLAPELPCILGDTNKLEQVFLNLISNAEDAMESMADRASQPLAYQKRLKISTYLDGGTVVAVIQDNGCGIAPADYEHMFEPFFTTKPVGQGTGLGLPISYGIVTEFEGQILFESTENEGTTFTLRFPSAPAKEPSLMELE